MVGNAESKVLNTAPWRVVVCGSTERTLMCAQSVASDARFQVVQVVSPSARPIGRKQVLTPTPVAQWAQENNLPLLTVDTSLREIREPLTTLHAAQAIDFLLVVDFGYLVPSWLLELPRFGPINVHPSDLPAFRGSSPGTFALLSGVTESAVCVMRMDVGLDTGPIIQRLPFAVQPTDTQTEYYARAFKQVQSVLPDVLAEYVQSQNHEPQPTHSTTIEAARLTKDDGYVPFAGIMATLGPSQNANSPVSPEMAEQFSPTLQGVIAATQPTLVQWIDRMTRALQPWPGAWTVVPQYKHHRDVRAKIHALGIINAQLTEITLQFAGESTPRQFTAEELSRVAAE